MGDSGLVLRNGFGRFGRSGTFVFMTNGQATRPQEPLPPKANVEAEGPFAKEDMLDIMLIDFVQAGAIGGESSLLLQATYGEVVLLFLSKNPHFFDKALKMLEHFLEANKGRSDVQSLLRSIRATPIAKAPQEQSSRSAQKSEVSRTPSKVGEPESLAAPKRIPRPPRLDRFGFEVEGKPIGLTLRGFKDTLRNYRKDPDRFDTDGRQICEKYYKELVRVRRRELLTHLPSHPREAVALYAELEDAGMLEFASEVDPKIYQAFSPYGIGAELNSGKPVEGRDLL
jgi:hypothetical protein